MKAARFHVNVADATERKQIYQSHIPYEVKEKESTDPSLLNRHVYGSRADWYAAAATVRFFDAGWPSETGKCRFLIPNELERVASKEKSRGMTLYG